MCEPILKFQPSKKKAHFGVLRSTTQDAEFEDPGGPGVTFWNFAPLKIDQSSRGDHICKGTSSYV
jgi:hypothetical protein